MTNDERNPTKGQRPLEWMRFDPVEFGLLCDGLTFAQVGALTKVMLHVWQRGPLSEADVRRIAKMETDAIMDLLTQHSEGMSLDMVEAAREYGEGRRRQRSEAGKASAAKRNEHSTTVERPLNDRPTDVLSMSVSVSSSKSNSSSKSEKKERAHEVLIWPTFDDWWMLYGKKADRAKCEAKWKRLDQPTREAIMEHTRRYVTQGRGADKQYRRDPATYLNNQNWNDEELATPRNDTRQPTQQLPSEKYARVMQLLEGSDPGDAGGAFDETRYLDGGRSE
jgi:hypothetical protein